MASLTDAKCQHAVIKIPIHPTIQSEMSAVVELEPTDQMVLAIDLMCASFWVLLACTLSGGFSICCASTAQNVGHPVVALVARVLD